jgi:hypothetical protein
MSTGRRVPYSTLVCGRQIRNRAEDVGQDGG